MHDAETVDADLFDTGVVAMIVGVKTLLKTTSTQ